MRHFLIIAALLANMALTYPALAEDAPFPRGIGVELEQNPYNIENLKCFKVVSVSKESTFSLNKGDCIIKIDGRNFVDFLSLSQYILPKET